MKHIALILPAMRMGGAEKISLNFLDYLTKYYKVTLILNKLEGELLTAVPSEVEIIEDSLLDIKTIIKSDLKRFKLFSLIKDFLYYAKIKTGHDSERNYRYLISRTPKRKEYYDLAIGYVANVSTQIFSVIDRIDADIKIGWLHGETTELKDTELFAEYYQKFDKIFAVSNVTKEHFVQRFPDCASKADVYYNPIRTAEIIEKSKESIPYSFNKSSTNIVTVGRLSPEKGISMIPNIVEVLLLRNCSVHWYIVGDGTERDEIEKQVLEKGLGDYITLTGNQLNPYPFIKQCDIYVQPSYEEGYSTTICEAGILGKAIVGTTTSGGIREQIKEGTSALLANPTPEDIANKIAYLIEHQQKRRELERNIKEIDFSNQKEIYKLLEMMK